MIRSIAVWARRPPGLLLRRNAVYLAGVIAASLLTYVYQFVAGRFLGRAAYGELASLVAAVYIVTLPQNVIGTVATRFAAEAWARRDHGAVGALIRRLTLRMGWVAAVVLGLFILAGDWIADFLGSTRGPRILILAGVACVFLFLAVNRGILQGTLRFGALSINFLVDTAIRVAACAALLGLGFGLAGALTALLLGPLVAYAQSVVALWRFVSVPGGRPVPDRQLLGFALPVSVGLLGVTYLFNIDVILARHYLSADAAGIYAAAAILGRVVFVATFSIAGVMFPEVTALHARNQGHFHVVELSIGLMATLALPMVVIYFALPGVVVLPFGNAFTGVAPYLGPLAAALSALSLSNLLINYQLSVRNRAFLPPLLLVCILEPLLIVLRHRSVGDVVGAVVIANGCLLLALGALYLWGRLRA